MQNSPRSHLNNALWRTRKSRGLAQKQVAWLLGHSSPSRISSYERGERTPNLVTALRLAAIYRCPVERLFPEHFDAIGSELSAKASKATGSLFTPDAKSHLVEDVSICSYERLLEQPIVNEENGRLVRKHVTKLARILAER
ncbi:MAG: helix-turn-helix transcriptional regulator [Chloracidobacterium sp.]|nr:helix-turn-helix transcriptional regulator [Chloracidobacterium sp.]